MMLLPENKTVQCPFIHVRAEFVRAGPPGTVKQAAPLCNGPGVDLLRHPWRPPSVLCHGLLICGSVLSTLQNPHFGLPISKFSPGFLSRTCLEGENRLSDTISKDAGKAWSWSGVQSAMEQIGTPDF
jgi:hypothetical protein